MKVTGLNNIVFRSAQVSTPDGIMPVNKESRIKELPNVTPDYNINVPVSYTKTYKGKLDNGLEIYGYKMSNGYRVTVVPMSGSPAVVKSYVNVGSLNETSDIKGISHFLEHMAFNGTNGENGHIELKQGDSFKKIDVLGGWANASTNYAITDYVNSTPLLENKDLETQIKVIAAMAEDLKLSEDMIAKEKGPVSSEINMILDNPQTIAMDQTVRTLFNIKNPADELVGGSVSHIKNLTRQNVLDYYNTYYTPDNTNIVITGDVDPQEAIKLVSKNFTSKRVSKGGKFEEKLSPLQKTARKDFVSDKATSAEIVIGFAGPKNNDTRGKIVYELASMYLKSHEAGLTAELKKLNTFPAIADEKISTNPNNNRLNFITLTPDDSNTEKVLQVVFNKLGNQKPVSEATVERIKQRLKQNNEDILEHSSSVNDCIGYSMLDNDLDYMTEYNKILDSITPQELDNAIKKYFDINKAAVTVIHPQKLTVGNESSVSFKGAKREPLDMNEVSRYTLANNFDAGFYNTKSNNINIGIYMPTNIPYSKKAGVAEVLNEIYKMGMMNIPMEALDDFKDKNNLKLTVNAAPRGIGATIEGDKTNYKLGLEVCRKLMYNPNITEENLKKAIVNLKDRMDRTQVTSDYIQMQIDNALNPYVFTRQQVRNNLDNISVDDVQELHNYLIKNSKGIVTANLPQNSEPEIVKSNILNEINKLKAVEPNKNRSLEIYREIEQPMVLTFANSNSQADISETFRFKYDDNLKDKVTAELMNSILSGSSIGLFDILREKENLAYSVHSDFMSFEDVGEVTLHILTTTDNKTIGEYSYDNVEKSINGFNRQIGELVNGKFTDEDLEVAKRIMKATLLNKEGNYSKLVALEMGMESKYGIDMENKIYNEIDNIKKEDIINFAKKVFSNKPVYSIVASQDTLNANNEFLEGLKQN